MTGEEEWIKLFFLPRDRVVRMCADVMCADVMCADMLGQGKSPGKAVTSRRVKTELEEDQAVSDLTAKAGCGKVLLRAQAQRILAERGEHLEKTSVGCRNQL